jgi:hypothetical protein
MFLVDFKKGELLNDDDIKSEFSKKNPYQKWLNEQQIYLSELHCEREAHGFPAVSLLVRIGWSMTKRCAFSDLLLKRLPSGPIEQRKDITISSRIESIAGLVTCAKSCLK